MENSKNNQFNQIFNLELHQQLEKINKHKLIIFLIKITIVSKLNFLWRYLFNDDVLHFSRNFMLIFLKELPVCHAFIYSLEPMYHVVNN